MHSGVRYSNCDIDHVRLSELYEGDLHAACLSELGRRFSSYDTHITDEQFWHLKIAAIQLVRMAYGVADQSVCMCSLDPGMGKTQLLLSFLCVLSSIPDCQDTGAVLFVSRLSEVDAAAADLISKGVSVAIQTSDDDLNRRSTHPPSKAQVLIATQQYLEHRDPTEHFDSLEKLHFRGRPRRVRIWDEAYEPQKSIVITADSLGRCVEDLRPLDQKAADKLDSFRDQVRAVDISTVMSIPQLDLPGSLPATLDTKTRDTLSDLSSFVDDQAAVTSHYHASRALVGWRPSLPTGLEPMMVFDASARFRQTYNLLTASGAPLVKLNHATKDYSSLTVTVHDHASSKSAWSEGYNELVPLVGQIVSEAPDQDWLIIHHKLVNADKLKQAIADLYKVAMERLHMLAIGHHHGTNAFSHIPNVIISGVNIYRPADYEGMYRACSKAPPETSIPKEYLSVLEASELDHFIYQAACRGSVRRCIDGQSAPCNLHIIASQKRYGLDTKRLQRLFPRCCVCAVRRRPKPLTKNQQAAIDYIRDRLTADYKAIVPYKEVQEHIGMKDRSNFRKWVRRHRDFEQALDELGYHEHEGLGRRGFVSAARVFNVVEGGYVHPHNKPLGAAVAA